MPSVGKAIRFVTSTADPSDLSLDRRYGLPSFLVTPAPRLHAVQFYEEESFLFDTVGGFIAAGLAAGDRIMVIATARHTEGFLARLDPRELEQARDAGRITLLDADLTLKKLLVDGMPDAGRFRGWLAEVRESESSETRTAPLRAYGEMVDLLAKGGNVRGAIRLEELWHEVLLESPFPMLCTYLMGAFFQPGDNERMMEVCAAHTHVIPTERFLGLADPDQRMREVTLLQQRELMLQQEVERREKFELALDNAAQDLGEVRKELHAWAKREAGRTPAGGVERRFQRALPRNPGARPAQSAQHHPHHLTYDGLAQGARARQSCAARTRRREQHAHAAHDRAAIGPGPRRAAGRHADPDSAKRAISRPSSTASSAK